MQGGIYSRQKCSICGLKFRDNFRNGLVCPEHPDQQSSKFIVKFNKVFKNFDSYSEAQRFLTGLRFKTDEGSFDSRDYSKIKPLAFCNLAEKWLKVKLIEMDNKRSWQNYSNYMTKYAVPHWGEISIKEIGYGSIEDFVNELIVAGKPSKKTIHEIISCLRAFWKWVAKREKKNKRNFEVPEFPKVDFNLGYRKLVDKETQHLILEKIKEISFHINPRIYLGVKWLSTYVAIRPDTMLKLTEYEVDAKTGYFRVPAAKTKEKKYRLVPMLDGDREIIASFPQSIDGDVPFFRHLTNRSGISAGKPFGKKYFYKWWKRACAELGIEGVDLYGGTKHSTVTALGEDFSPEEIKKYATQHTSNKAFDRYFHVNPEKSKNLYAVARDKVATTLQPKIMEFKKG